MRNIVVLGSTGSIGSNTLEVIAQNPGEFRLIGIAAGENIELLKTQVTMFSPGVVAVKHKSDAESLRRIFPGKRILHSNEGLLELIAEPGVDTMVAAIDGTTALEATLASIRNNHRICLANKETLVAAGELIDEALQHSNAEIIPVDSEQSAIFQCLEVDQNSPPISNERFLRGSGKAWGQFFQKEPPGRQRQTESIKRVILTASGGPFFKQDKETFPGITIKQALAHPTWAMGTKITIDSATLMNKALEVIEAYFLFHLKKEQIDVIIHPQSIIHSMVEFIDSAVLAQLSVPDMKLPILYSLSYPQRVAFPVPGLDFAGLKKLEFFEVDRERFPSISMAYHALEQGKNSGAVLNAANEVAVDYFLQEKIAFSDIFAVVAQIFYHETFYPLHSVADVKESIERTKQKTHEYIKRNHFKAI
jgi:1-deoxy-D-xylulose-5-phosphate reductoisomerase